ncbi:hypothetical protein V8C34DRAFT_41802 [Trichoderma compactum]
MGFAPRPLYQYMHSVTCRWSVTPAPGLPRPSRCCISTFPAYRSPAISTSPRTGYSRLPEFCRLFDVRTLSDRKTCLALIHLRPTALALGSASSSLTTASLLRESRSCSSIIARLPSVCSPSLATLCLSLGLSSLSTRHGPLDFNLTLALPAPQKKKTPPGLTASRPSRDDVPHSTACEQLQPVSHKSASLGRSHRRILGTSPS